MWACEVLQAFLDGHGSLPPDAGVLPSPVRAAVLSAQRLGNGAGNGAEGTLSPTQPEETPPAIVVESQTQEAHQAAPTLGDVEMMQVDSPKADATWTDAQKRDLSPLPATPVQQPSTPASSVGGFAVKSVSDVIPSISDRSAPRPKAGELQLSPGAIYQRAYRIFQPRADGSLKVSAKIVEEWRQKGPPRQMLEQIFQQCGYDPASWRYVSWYFYRSQPLFSTAKATFITEVEVLREEMKESELEVEGEYLTSDAMFERGFSECLVCS